MFDLGDVGEKIGNLVGGNVEDSLKNTVSGIVEGNANNNDEFNKLVQELITKVTSKVGDVSNAGDSQISEAINTVIAGVDLKSFDKSKLVAAIKQGIEILKHSFGK